VSVQFSRNLATLSPAEITQVIIVAQIGNLPCRRLAVGKPKFEGKIMNDETNPGPKFFILHSSFFIAFGVSAGGASDPSPR
jgi:hypothetical protein